MADYLNIAGRVRTTASDGVAIEAQEVKDLNLNKSQQEVNADVQTELGDRYTKEETYNREEIEELVEPTNYVSVVATNATTAVTDVLPATGEANTIYRVGNWDGTQYDTTMYALYAWNGSAYVCLAVRSFVGEVYDVSVNHPNGQGNPTPYIDIVAALGTDGANIPADIRRGGMSIKFIQGTVQSSDNKYVQARCMAQNFTTDVTQWQGVDDELIAGSKNLIESNGVTKAFGDFNLFPCTNITPYQISNDWKLSGDGYSSSDMDFCLVKYQVTPGQLLKVNVSKDNEYVMQFQVASNVPGRNTGTLPSLVGNVITGAVNGLVKVPETANYLILSQLERETPICSVEVVSGYTVDNSPVEDSNNLVKSGGVYQSIKTLNRNIGLDCCIDKEHFDYVFVKNSSSSTPQDDENGTRLRMVVILTKPVIVDISSSYLYICNTYYDLSNALLASNETVETLTGISPYITGSFKKTTTVSGYLSLSLRKEDNSVITDEDKAAILEDLSANIYTPDGIYTKIPKMEYLKTVFSGQVVNIPENVHDKLISIGTDETGLTFYGKNLLDKSTLMYKQIKNDSGVVVSDNSSYYSIRIPCHGMTIQSNVNMQRVYKYDINGDFIGRENVYTNRFLYIVPSDTYFIQIQVQTPSDTICVIIDNGHDSTDYAPYVSSNSIENIKGTVNVVKNGVDIIDVNLEINCNAVIPAVGYYDFWEPETVTDDYKCTHRGQSTQSIPALTDTLKYSGFLSTYFDIYLGEHQDGYSVTKEELGLDSGAVVEHKANPIFSYTFAPKYYNKTVLLSAGMNTCEASTYFGLAYFVKALMEHTEAGMLALYKSTRFVIIPVICPTGISHDPLLYLNANGVRINKNFSYSDSWQYNYDRGGQYPGDYPDSEVETKILKNWMNRYSNAIFYMDCHSDTGGQDSQANTLTVCFCSDDAIKTKLQTRNTKITDYYRNKGFIPSGTTPTMTYSLAGNVYPKTPYSWDILKVPAMMHEQYIRSTMYGSDGNTNNDSYGIKNYCAIIRWYCLIMCKSGIGLL